MAQTTGQLSAAANKLEVSTDGSSWTDISGSTNIVDVPEQSIATGSTPTFGDKRQLVSNGPQDTITIGVTVVYTEEPAEAFETTRAIFETLAPVVYLRWSPKGGSATNFQYTTDKGRLSGFQYPPATMTDGSPIQITFSVFTSGVNKAVVST